MTKRFAQTSLPLLLGTWLERLAFVLLLVAVVFAPLTQGSIQSWDPLGLRIVMIASLVLAVVAASLLGDLRLAPPILLVPLLLYLNIALLSAFFSPYQHGSLQAVLNTLVYAGGFLAAAMLCRTEARRNLLLAAFCLAALAMGVHGLLQGLAYGWPGAPQARVSSFYANPNH